MRLPGPQDRRTHAVEEDERPDQPALGRGQRAADLEAADVLGVRDDHQFDLVAGEGVAGFGIVAGKEAHERLPRYEVRVEAATTCRASRDASARPWPARHEAIERIGMEECGSDVTASAWLAVTGNTS